MQRSASIGRGHDGQRHRAGVRAGGLRRARCVDAAPSRARPRAQARSRRASAKFVEKGKLDGGGPRRHARAARVTDRRSTASPTPTSSSRRSSRTLEVKRALFARARRADAARRHPRVQHLVDLDHRARRGDQAAGPRARHALHEPGAADDAGRADPRPGDVGRDDARRRRELCARARQDAGRGGRLSRASSPTAS